jgi:hypothetical protein
MRKLVSLGLFALMFSIFSGHVFAGNVDLCEPLKDKTVDGYIPGLYGLCTAWHNADDAAKDRIAERFAAKGGGIIPGSDVFDCVCWDVLSYDQVCKIANSPTAVAVSGKNAITFLDFPESIVTGFGADESSCQLFVFDTSLGEEVDPSLALNFPTELDIEGEDVDCMSEVLVISTFRNNEELCPSN